ncbi:Retinol dehydrogenase 8 [Pleurostoma richardsiae]|uniref:Retinol dehydrogenase 8 n=1 Tax=Pleurostoma richardsiae TaxID=41990 RepID=A0AA38RJJ2_9PEZI|nr:Retinol dehydrogenase 8 [Pleurostoma richardsiae]
MSKHPLTWLITGSSSGFGLLLTRYAQAHGHKVIATSRNPSRTPELVREVEDKGGRWLQLDVDDQQSGAVVDRLEEGGEAIDVLVNNAGWSAHGPAEAFSEPEVKAQVETIFFGPYRLMRAVAPYMRKRRSGIIVNISAAGSLWGMQTMAPYSAAKAALDGVSKVMSDELADFGVRVLIVQLGGFNTNMPNVIRGVEKPLDEDYKGKTLDLILQALQSGKFEIDGDPHKAAKIIYEVIVGEGIGEGKEKELILPLGKEAAQRAKKTIETWTHVMEVFGDVCTSVSVDK